MTRRNAQLPNLIASAARTTDHVGAWVTNPGYDQAHFLVNVTAAAGSTASFRVSIEGRVPGSTKSYDLLVGAAITGAGVTALKVGPGMAASTGASAQDLLPGIFRVTSTHAGAQSLTYEVGAYLG